MGYYDRNYLFTFLRQRGKNLIRTPSVNSGRPRAQQPRAKYTAWYCSSVPLCPGPDAVHQPSVPDIKTQNLALIVMYRLFVSWMVGYHGLTLVIAPCDWLLNITWPFFIFSNNMYSSLKSYLSTFFNLCRISWFDSSPNDRRSFLLSYFCLQVPFTSSQNNPHQKIQRNDLQRKVYGSKMTGVEYSIFCLKVGPKQKSCHCSCFFSHFLIFHSSSSVAKKSQFIKML